MKTRQQESGIGCNAGSSLLIEVKKSPKRTNAKKCGKQEDHKAVREKKKKEIPSLTEKERKNKTDQFFLPFHSIRIVNKNRVRLDHSEPTEPVLVRIKPNSIQLGHLDIDPMIDK